MLNRANARMTVFEDDGDYEAFEKVLVEAVESRKRFLTPFLPRENDYPFSPEVGGK